MRLKWHKKGKKGEEKAVKLSLGTFKSEVLLARITKNDHKKGGYNLRHCRIPAQSFYE